MNTIFIIYDDATLEAVAWSWTMEEALEMAESLVGRSYSIREEPTFTDFLAILF